MTNVDAKVGSKVIATRLQKVLPEIIHFNQNAYVKGKTIFDAVRTIVNIMEFTERYQMNGLLVAIDFKKASDSINHDFMFKALSVFNFGPSLIRWIQIFYKNISSTVMNNRVTRQPLFKIFRGVRQGDLLSPYLFIICLEVLAINIRLNKDIHGIMVGNEEIKLEIFADDMTAFLRDHASLDTLLNMVHVDSFSLHSGLKIKFEMTEVLFLETVKNQQRRLLCIGLV